MKSVHSHASVVCVCVDVNLQDGAIFGVVLNEQTRVFSDLSFS